MLSQFTTENLHQGYSLRSLLQYRLSAFEITLVKHQAIPVARFECNYEIEFLEDH